MLYFVVVVGRWGVWDGWAVGSLGRWICTNSVPPGLEPGTEGLERCDVTNYTTDA